MSVVSGFLSELSTAVSPTTISDYVLQAFGIDLNNLCRLKSLVHSPLCRCSSHAHDTPAQILVKRGFGE